MTFFSSNLQFTAWPKENLQRNQFRGIRSGYAYLLSRSTTAPGSLSLHPLYLHATRTVETKFDRYNIITTYAHTNGRSRDVVGCCCCHNEAGEQSGKRESRKVHVMNVCRAFDRPVKFDALQVRPDTLDDLTDAT